MKKNDRVKFNNRTGTVMANQYRHYNKGVWDAYTEVMFDDSQYIESVLTMTLEVI